MVLACSHSRSLQLLARLDARTEFEILEHSLEGGVEAGRAHHCIRRMRFKLTLIFAFRVIDMQFNQLDTQLTNLTRN